MFTGTIYFVESSSGNELLRTNYFFFTIDHEVHPKCSRERIHSFPQSTLGLPQELTG